jgi:hypothetical protein
VKRRLEVGTRRIAHFNVTANPTAPATLKASMNKCFLTLTRGANTIVLTKKISKRLGRKIDIPHPTYASKKNKDDDPIEECLATKTQASFSST